MALRTFQTNPSLGGFGGESGIRSAVSSRPKPSAKDKAADLSKYDGGVIPSLDVSCDAFAQILKELVDNAVDACCGTTSYLSSSTPSPAVLKRVRVRIESEEEESERSGSATESDREQSSQDWKRREVLRVTVTDNGCGMKNIEDCVAVFGTSKAGGASVVEFNDASSQQSEEREETQGDSNEKQQRDFTAGRYGIGLTLCLLHAQRLVPGSCASITSATSSAIEWTRASFVVDTDKDDVRCVKKEVLPKRKEDDCGTAVSLLVPGGLAARKAWPRLAEYFARFQLSLGLTCSVEVMAPTLSSVPLFVRPPIELERGGASRESNQCKPSLTDIAISDTYEEKPDALFTEEENVSDSDNEEHNNWTDGLDETKQRKTSSGSTELAVQAISDEKVEDDGDGQRELNASDAGDELRERPKRSHAQCSSNQRGDVECNESHRLSLLKASSSYLNKALELKNVAHSIQPIRYRNYGTRSRSTDSSSSPMLEVDLIVYEPDEDVPEETLSDESDVDGDEFENMFSRHRATKRQHRDDQDQKGAKLMLIRMVNRIPLLDGSEAAACGIVKGICKHQSTWNSFGLDIAYAAETIGTAPIAAGNSRNTKFARTGGNSMDPSFDENLHVPTFRVVDSVQVAPFFQSSTHSLFEPDDKSECDGEFEESYEECTDSPSKRRRRQKRKPLLPAGLRIGNVLIITQIHAKPSDLPLPTLSKGRLPMNDSAIDDALEIGIKACLVSLQRTNPGLLLSAQQLKRTERDVKYVPAVGAATASVVCRSRDRGFQTRILDRVLHWGGGAPNLATLPSADIEQNGDSPDLPTLVSHDIQRSQKNESGGIHPLSGNTADAGSYTSNGAFKMMVETSNWGQKERYLRVNKLGPMIEERLRLVLSDHHKIAKKEQQRELQRKEREEAIAAEKQRKRSRRNGESWADGDSDGSQSSLCGNRQYNSDLDSDDGAFCNDQAHVPEKQNPRAQSDENSSLMFSAASFESASGRKECFDSPIESAPGSICSELSKGVQSGKHVSAPEKRHNFPGKHALNDIGRPPSSSSPSGVKPGPDGSMLQIDADYYGDDWW